MQDSVAVPEPLRVLGVIVPQVSPVGTVSVRATAPAKPACEVTVIVDEADEPVFTAAGDVAEIVKSGVAPKVNVTVVEWDKDPLAPVILTVKAF